MSAEQGDAEAIREALHFCSDVHGERTAQAVDATGALDRLAAALERAERERDAIQACDCLPVHYSSAACPKCGRRGVAYEGIPHSLEVRAEKAEKERDEAREEVLFLCDDEDDIRKGLRDRAKKAELALAEILNELGVPDESYAAPVANAVEIARAALRGHQR